MVIAAGVAGSDTLPLNTIMKQIFTTAFLLIVSACVSLANDLNTARIDEVTGLKGKMNEKEGVYKITFPRDDVKIAVDESVVKWLLRKAREESNSGARPLRRAIQRYIEDELSEFMIRHKDTVPERIDFTMHGDEVLLVPRAVEEPLPT